MGIGANKLAQEHAGSACERHLKIVEDQTREYCSRLKK